jgi:hypothetical protein
MVVVEQTFDGPFNRGLLMNAGVKESVKLLLTDLIHQNASLSG